MHELSVATALVSTATDAADRAHARGMILSVRIRVGELSGVVPEALEFAWPLAAEGTRCHDAQLRIERVPCRIRCAACNAETELVAPFRLRCGLCGSRDACITTGRELELVSLELAEDEPPTSRGGRLSATAHS